MQITPSPSALFFDEISSFINANSSLQDPLESDPPLLENKLSDWIAHSTFPSNFFHPVLRGLPRQFLQTDPSISIVKRAFRNEPILIRQWLERPLLTLYSIDLLHNPLCLEKSEIFSQVFRNCLQFRISRMSRLEESRREIKIKTCEKRTILPDEWGYARDLKAAIPSCYSIHITLLTWVIADGWGDLFCQIEAAAVLHSYFPHLKLTLFTLVHEDKDPPSYDHPFEQHRIRFTGKLNGTITIEPFSSSQLKTISQSDLVLEIPTPFPHLDKLLGQLPKIPPLARIGEHSMIDTIHYQPETSAWSMGLHFLEKGIFIKKVPQASQNLHLKNQNLKQLILGAAQDWEQYRQKNRFQIAYTKNYRGLYLYLMALLTSLDDDEKNIDICFFQMDLLAMVLEYKFKDPRSQEYLLLKAWNIGELQLYFENFQSVIPIAKSGKRVRLIHCRSLDHDDQLVLTSLSDRLIGATGDQSVLEAISTGKPFFFDPPTFKRPFLRDLLCIAEKKLQAFPCLAEFFKLCLKNPSLPLEDNQQGWVSEEYLDTVEARLSLEDNTDISIGKALGQLLKDPAMPQAFEALRQYLADSYSIEPILTGLVRRTLLIKYNPSLVKQEEAEVQKLLNGKQTLDQMLQNVSTNIY